MGGGMQQHMVGGGTVYGWCGAHNGCVPEKCHSYTSQGGVEKKIRMSTNSSLTSSQHL